MTIFEYVKKTRDNYRTDTIEVTDGYDFSQYETLRTIELYHNSKFLSTNKDSLGREKPFYNITKFRVNVAVRATDLDTKDVHIQSDRPGKRSYIQSFVLSLKNRNWMKESGLAAFLNKMGHTRAKYGHVVVKTIEHDNKLEFHVMRWRDLITDQLDIASGVKIERHYYTPAELKTAAPKNWKNIDEAIKTAKASKEAEAAKPGAKENKTPGNYIEVYEVHGVLPTCYLRETSEKYGKEYGSEDEYERQMHVVVLDESDKENTKGVTLFGGIEDEDPYDDLPWEKVDGRGLGVGVVEDLFESQVWTNYGVKQKKDILDLAGKIIYKTTASNFAAQNILTDVENGHIFDVGPNGDLQQVNQVPTSLPALSDLIDEWNKQAERVSSTPEAMTGETMPSGTPFRLVAALNREAGSQFVYRRQEAGLFLQLLYRKRALPFLVKQTKNGKNKLTGNLQPDELEMVANAMAQVESMKFAKDKILGGSMVSEEEVQQIYETTRREHMAGGQRRDFTFPEHLMDGWQGSVDVITTGEQDNKNAALETLFNVFQVLAKFPQALQDPVMARIFNQMVEKAGVSPLLLGTGSSSAAATPAATPTQAPAQAGAIPANIAPQTTSV